MHVHELLVLEVGMRNSVTGNKARIQTVDAQRNGSKISNSNESQSLVQNQNAVNPDR